MARNNTYNYGGYLGVPNVMQTNIKPYNYTDKEACIGSYVRYFLARTMRMFKWNNLPESIPARSLELLLQYNGAAIWFHADGELHVSYGGLGGEPDANYMPTLAIVANPYLRMYDHNMKIDDECIVMPNDSMYQGLLPLLRRYSTQIAEADITMNLLLKLNLRLPAFMTAMSDEAKESCLEMLKDIMDGKPGVIGDIMSLITNNGDVNVNPFGASAGLAQDVIELRQYALSNLYNEIGLQSNYNMKREAITAGEAQMNEDCLYPFIDDMLAQRQHFAEKVNEMFGTDISVELDSTWQDNQEELELEQEVLEAEADSTELGENTNNEFTEEPVASEEESSADNDDPGEEESSSDNDDPGEEPEEVVSDPAELIEEAIEQIVEEVIEGGEEDEQEETTGSNE